MKAWLHVLGVLLCVAVITPTIVRRPERTDLHILLESANRLKEGKAVYTLADANEHTKPPFATMLAMPLLRVNPVELSRIWDALNIAVYVLLSLLIARHLAVGKNTLTLAMLGLLFTLSNWNQEIRLGQYNVLTLALLMAAALLVPGFVSGILVTVALLFKPTNILFLPWVWSRSSSRKGLVIGALTSVAILSVLYALWIGPLSLLADNIEWIRFLPQSTAKHLHRLDNYSLVRIADELGRAPLVPWLWVAGAAIVTCTAYLGTSWVPGLAAAGVVSAVLSPMAWFQNYTLCLPFVLLVWARLLSSPPGFRKGAFAASLTLFYVGLQLYNPTLLSAGAWGGLRWMPIPLWATLASAVIGTVGLLTIRSEARQPMKLKATEPTGL